MEDGGNTYPPHSNSYPPRSLLAKFHFYNIPRLLHAHPNVRISIHIYTCMPVDPLQRNMNNAAKTEAAREKAAEPRKPQNPEALRAQEQKVTHDKVVNICV